MLTVLQHGTHAEVNLGDATAALCGFFTAFTRFTQENTDGTVTLINTSQRR